MTQTRISFLEKVIDIPVKEIQPFKNQPRKYFDQKKLQELAESIEAVGQIVPGLVKKNTGNNSPYSFELVDGQRRWHALQIAGIEYMRVILIDPQSEKDQFMLSVICNFGREGHTPIETADAVQFFYKKGVSIAEIAKIFARSQPWVYQYLKIFKLDDEIKKMMSPENPEDKKLPFSAAIFLADLPKDMQRKVANVIIKRGLKINQARNLIRMEADKIGLTAGNPKRSPRDDYKILLSFLKRTRRDAEIFDEKNQSFFDELFKHRKSKDVDDILKILEENINILHKLWSALRKIK